jgi:3-carboxy-cis,cis-muconate cycloisomerase
LAALKRIPIKSTHQKKQSLQFPIDRNALYRSTWTGVPMPTSALDSLIFRDLFGSPAMRAIWSDAFRTQKYLDFEAALARAEAKVGLIPHEAAAEISRVCKVENIDFEAYAKETVAVGYPVLGLVHQIAHLCRGDAGKYCHWGATTQDITDSATILQIKASFDLIGNDLARAIAAAEKLARDHRSTPMAARSNLQQAVPITFGFKMARLLATLVRHRARLADIRPRIEVFEFGGAAGTLATLGDKGLAVQEALAHELGLAQPEIAWHTERDRIAEAGCFLGLLTGTLAKFATDLKLMMQTEVGEAGEPYVANRGSSSTMPQKRNPISCCYIHACAASVRQGVAALLDAMVEDHERATGPWEIEWITLPDIFTLAGGALAQACFVLEGLEVHAERMRTNLDATRGLIVSEAVMMALAPKLGRDTAHDVLYAIIHDPAMGDKSLAEVLLGHADAVADLGEAEIRQLTDPTKYLGLSEVMVDRALAASKR